MRKSVVLDHSLDNFEVGTFIVVHRIFLGLGLGLRVAALIGALEGRKEADKTALGMVDLLVVLFARANVEGGHGELCSHELDDLIVVTQSGILVEDFNGVSLVPSKYN